MVEVKKEEIERTNEKKGKKGEEWRISYQDA